MTLTCQLLIRKLPDQRELVHQRELHQREPPVRSDLLAPFLVFDSLTSWLLAKPTAVTDAHYVELKLLGSLVLELPVLGLVVTIRISLELTLELRPSACTRLPLFNSVTSQSSDANSTLLVVIQTLAPEMSYLTLVESMDSTGTLLSYSHPLQQAQLVGSSTNFSNVFLMQGLERKKI